MKKNEKKKQQILLHLSVLPIVSGQQLQKLFEEYGQPEKRMSECLRELKKEGLIEGMNRPLGESKIWRLSADGRKSLSVTYEPVPLTNRNIEHYLQIANVYFYLQPSDSLTYFKVEPRLPFLDSKNKAWVYAPDGFFIWSNEPFFLEVQRSPLSQNKWKEKWSVAEAFYKASLPYQYEKWLFKNIVTTIVIANQTPSIIAQTELPLQVGSDIQKIFSYSEPKKQKNYVKLTMEELQKDIAICHSHYKLNTPLEKKPPLSKEAYEKYRELLYAKGKA